LKIAFIGAGSVVFTKNLLTDTLSFPELHETTIALHDIDPERLETAGMMARWTSDQLGADAKVEEHLDRRRALEGTDFVVNLLQYAETRRKLLAGEDFSLGRSVEYGSLIIHSLLTGEARAIYGNVENTGLVTNLPEGCCVEVPILVDDRGLRPCHVGDLPPQCAATCAPHTAVQNLTVRAALEGRRDHVHHAAMLDRHAASVLSLDEIAEMVDELIDAHGGALPEGVRTAARKQAR
jgi:alpha-galactosidase/6-phospho-beta-glucosidase family protein